MKNENKPRVLLYDIETAPNLAYVWGKWQQDVITYEAEWYMLCFSYRWLGEKTTHVVALPDFKSYKKDQTNDRELVIKLWELFNEADIVIAHNGDSFDQKKSNARFLFHGLTPPSPYKSVDTLKVARRYFKFNSSKLDDLGNTLGIGRKVVHGGFSTWLGCMSGDERSWSLMKKYNKQDVVLLEKVYLKLRPWIDGHPAMNLLSGKLEACPKCSVVGKMQRRGTSVTKTLTYQRYQCLACGGWSRERLSEKAPVKVRYVN